MTKKPHPLPIIITAVFCFAGAFLTALSIFFGKHYIIEAFIMYGLSAIMCYILMINMKFNITIDLLTKIMTDFTKVLEKAEHSSPMHFPGVDIKSFEIKQDEDGNISTNASPDELNFLKENGPAFIKEMFSSITNTKDQPLDKMSDKKLSDELKKAIEKEDFERANAIKKEMEQRTKK